jgi:hypothetical protein
LLSLLDSMSEAVVIIAWGIVLAIILCAATFLVVSFVSIWSEIEQDRRQMEYEIWLSEQLYLYTLAKRAAAGDPTIIDMVPNEQ